MCGNDYKDLMLLDLTRCHQHMSKLQELELQSKFFYIL